MPDTFRFWFDLENAPDVLFFDPIAARLREMGHDVLTTSRDYSDVPALAKIYNLDGPVIGGYAGSSKVAKVVVGLGRALRLARWALGKRIDLAVGFGVRPQPIAARLIGVPSATVFDYEHVSIGALNKCCRAIYVPEEVSVDYLVSRGTPAEKIIRYKGLKEEVYAADYEPAPDVRDRLGVPSDKIAVVVRPPATSAHYHEHSSEEICRRIMKKLVADPRCLVLFSRRDNDATFDEFLDADNVHLLKAPVKGLDLIGAADVVVSGGGTMVREAVAMGVPAYSIFTGRQGAVDQRLSEEGRLVLARRVEDVEKITFAPRAEAAEHPPAPPILDFFVNDFLRLAETRRAAL